MRNDGNVSGSAFFDMSQTSPLADDAPPTAAGKILIFSEHGETRLLLKTLLKIWDYAAAAEAATLSQAHAFIDEHKPPLMILDAVFPFEDNLKFVRRIRRDEFAGALPIIILSGYAQPNFRMLAEAAGADEFFVKPLDFDEFHNSLDAALEKQSKKYVN